MSSDFSHADLARVDFAPAPDLASLDLGAKRHLGEPCDVDAECLSGDCVTPDESRGQFDQVCGQVCARTGQAALPPCVEGICMTYDYDVYWCLQACDAPNHNEECNHGFLCCSGGDGVQACVSPAAIACLPL